ncbi:hypothetical protein C8R47DRAFT_1066028 [Mycena vitilis]|nr:hypothetical protein C8R47DRAFT_1066028 [Mycena vitilis]
MFTVSQTITFFQAWLGEALAWFLSLFARAGVKVDDVECASTVVGSAQSLLADVDVKSAEDHDLVTPATAADVDSPTEPEKYEPTGPELISAAVAASHATLPSLPSILKTPEARPPPETAPSAPQKQHFGPPTNLFYEHRLPFGNVTNLPRFGAEQKGIRVDNFEVKPLAPRKIRSKSKANVKKAKKAQVPAIVVVDTDAPEVSKSAAEVVSATKTVPVAAPVNVLEFVLAPLTVLESAAAPFNVLDSVPASVLPLEPVAAPVVKRITASVPALEYIAAPVLKSVSAPVNALEAVSILQSVGTLKTAPAPGPAEWNRAKSAALAQARTFSDHVKASHRVSLPAPAPFPVPALVPWSIKRHSAPPVLSAPRKSLQDRLSALLAATTDTIAALSDEKADKNDKKDAVRTKNNGVPEIRDAIKEAKRVSAAALEEGREVFTVGVDSDAEDDDEDEDDIPLGQLILTGKARQAPPVSILPTVAPTSTPRLISSISASRSMAGLANGSSRSLDELLDGHDAAMNGMGWRRLLARSDDINRRRRNDSIV